MQWIRDKAGVAHPEDSWLLAFTRWQPLDEDGPLRFHQHLQQCPVCQKKCEAYVGTSGQLGVLARLQAQQRYEAAFSEHVLESLNRGKKFSYRSKPVNLKAKRPKRSINFVSDYLGRQVAIPLAMFCIFLLLLGTVALAYSSFRLPHGQFTLPSNVPTGTAQVGMKITQHLTPTSTVAASTPVQAQTPTAAVTSTASPQGTPATATSTPAAAVPTITACNNTNDTSHFQMRICGSGFNPGDNVALVIDQPQSGVKLLNSMNVDGQGNFEATFPIHNCHNIPVAIYAQDQTDHTKSSGVLQNITYGNCPTPNQNPGENPGT